jgi:hypothetical protein
VQIVPRHSGWTDITQTIRGGVMPYILSEKRPALDKIVDEMREEADVKADGDLNYILFAFCKRYVEPSYNNYKNYCGELRQCATEIERRLLADYEDLKMEENGDV